MKSLKKMRTLSIKQIVFAIITLILTVTYTSIFNVSLGIELIAVIALITFIYFRHMAMDAVGWIAVMGVTLALLFLSGRIGERGFNAPIAHALKFVSLATVYTMTLAVGRFTVKQKKMMLKCIVAANLLSMVVSIYNTIAVDMYAIRYFQERGFTTVTDFNQAYAIPILLSIMLVLFLFTRKKSFKIMLIAIMGLCFFFLVKSLYTFALLMGVMGAGLVVGGVIWEKTKKSTVLIIVVIIIMLILCVYLFAEPISDFLYDMTESMNWIVRARIRSVIDTVLMTTHDNWYSSERRDELASYSMNTFARHPLLGVGYEGYGYGVIGAHQEWPDLLGVFGSVGMLIFVILFAMSIRQTFRRLRHPCDRTAFVVSLIMFVIQGFLNPCLSLPLLAMVFIVAPNISVLLEKEISGTVK